MAYADSPHSSFPIFGIAESKRDAHKNDCNGIARAMALAVGVPLGGLADAMADNWNTDPGWTEPGNDPAKAGQLAAQGYLVVAGKKEAGHGHVIVPGEGPHRTDMGCRERLGASGSRTRGSASPESAPTWQTCSTSRKMVPSLRAKPMRAGVAGVLGSLAVAGTALASGTGPAMVQIIPRGSSAKVGSYHLDLGDPDDPKAPRAWQGPIRINSDGKTGCTVSEDVAIVEKPLDLAQGHLLYATTYSGSRTLVHVVDVWNCAVKWTSPSFEGAPKFTGGTLTLPGHRPLKVGADGLPVTRRWKLSARDDGRCRGGRMCLPPPLK